MERMTEGEKWHTMLSRAGFNDMSVRSKLISLRFNSILVAKMEFNLKLDTISFGAIVVGAHI